MRLRFPLVISFAASLCVSANADVLVNMGLPDGKLGALSRTIRNENLAPHWLRIGTDIVGPPVTGGPPPTFNMAFSLTGETVPEPASYVLCGSALAAVMVLGRKKLVCG